MPGFASLSIASMLKVASLNLCVDEYLLLLAKPGEIASVSRLAQDPLESPLWRLARRYPGNRGEIEQVIGARPTLLLTMGGGGRSTGLLAGRLGIRTIDLPYPASVGDVAANMRRVATVLGDERRAEPWLKQLAVLEAGKPSQQRDSIWISGGGISLSSGTPGMEWMALAGLAQRRLPGGGRADLETLLVRPPAVLVKSDYRRGQMSRGNAWFDHPIVRRLRSRTIATDGRVWTCGGPVMLGEVERLRSAAR
jgi:iron complex transport system substrate-binding protein